MSPATNSVLVATDDGARLVKVLGSVAMISGLLIVLVYQVTLPSITQQKAKALQTALLKVIPRATFVKAYVIDGAILAAPTDSNQNNIHVYAGYDGNGNLAGIAAEGSAQGYADAVRVLYGYSPECQCITSFHVVSSRETPGFGDKLATDTEFLSNFAKLDATLNTARDGIAHGIVTVKHGTKREPWQIDSISGATVSSRAVGRALNESASRVLPVLHSHLVQLRHRSD